MLKAGKPAIIGSLGVSFGEMVVIDIFRNNYMRLKQVLGALVVVWLMPVVWAGSLTTPPGEQPCAALKNATVLIIRHAEKPPSGSELTSAGRARAQAYVAYFAGFKMDGEPLKLEHIFCTADTAGSHRPRSTVEPLSAALHLPLDNRFKTKDPAALTGEIRSRSHGKAILICWHHGEIPALLSGLGANPAGLLPGGEWPPDEFGWVVELRYNEQGRLKAAHCVKENWMPEDGGAAVTGNKP